MYDPQHLNVSLAAVEAEIDANLSGTGRFFVRLDSLLRREVRHLLVPLERLHQVVRKSETDLSAHAALPKSRNDEIGDLATTFSAVMRTLSERTTALMEAREKAEEREMRMQAIADQLPDFISYIDVNERYVFVNHAYEQRQELQQLEQRGLTDHLTGLLNRIGFEQRLASAMAQTDVNSRMMALLLVDLDDFKKVNDISQDIPSNCRRFLPNASGIITVRGGTRGLLRNFQCNRAEAARR